MQKKSIAVPFTLAATGYVASLIEVALTTGAYFSSQGSPEYADVAKVMIPTLSFMTATSACLSTYALIQGIKNRRENKANENSFCERNPPTIDLAR